MFFFSLLLCRRDRLSSPSDCGYFSQTKPAPHALHHQIFRFSGPSVASARRLLVLYVCKYKHILTIQCHEICKLFLTLNLSILCLSPLSITTPRCQGNIEINISRDSPMSMTPESLRLFETFLDTVNRLFFRVALWGNVMKNLTSIPPDTVTFRKGSTTLIFNTGQAKLDLHKVLSALRQIFPTCTDGYKTFIQWQVYLLINSWYHASTSWTEAKLLDEIQTKVLRVFFLAIHSHLYSFALRFLVLQTHATSYSFYSVLKYTRRKTW